jgi:putative holliday junction resolvase
MTRVVGIDLGSRRIGVAVSDGLGITAQPHATITRHGGLRDLEAIAAVVREVGATRVVLGLPVNHNPPDPHHGHQRREPRPDADPEALEAQEPDAIRRARTFGEKLGAHLQLPVELVDESFSTVEAEAVLLAADLSRARRREVIDKLAAAVILQRWLDQQRASGGSPA